MGEDGTMPSLDPDDAGNCPAGTTCHFGKECGAPGEIWHWCAGFDSICTEGLVCSACMDMCLFG